MERITVPQRHWALFLDIDGTLIDIAPRPQDVVVPADLPGLLQAVSDRLGGALALVSGRALEIIDRLMAPLRLPAAAEHGAIVRLPDGSVQTCVARSVPLSWRKRLRVETKDWTGVLVGEKHASVAVHYRLAPEHEEDVRALVMRITADDPDFEVLPARMAFEIRPRGADKGTAIRRFLETAPFRGRVPVFVGDDVTDEDGFAVARDAGGLGLHVARDFDGETANVRRWLKTVATELASGT
ncbi:trehalose-phosphatase [Rhizomicrobium electricum]|uniref:Trehalose 6-phosphate phosphatase n=1 Tax=Rhizomicrobium electricum TaxID=480070 RepID=A0ABP3Q3Y5_9PROT|nr:trehalose-phosphatase [Rhizomicrobium electricum]NIJ50281.1 trehalose 6-phosphate phosphatase [Rhizomicrobium electricum]